VKFDNVEFNAKYDFTAAWYVAAMYLYTTESVRSAYAHNSPHRNEIGLMSGYYLSKHTQVYVQGDYEKASGNDTFATAGGFTESSSQNQTAVRVGIRTSF
jgi:GBP family porin